MNRLRPQRLRYFSAIIGTVLVFGMAQAVDATGGSIWVNDNAIAIYETVHDQTQSTPRSCVEQNSLVIKQDGTSEQKQLCVVHGSSLSLASFRSSNGYENYAVKFLGDTSYRTVRGVTTYNTRLHYLPALDIIVKHNYTYNLSRDIPSLGYYPIAREAFEPSLDTSGGGVFMYGLNDSSLKGILTYNSGSKENQYARPINWTLSSNGRYIATNVDYNAFVWVDLLTGEERAIQKSGGSWYGGYTTPKAGAVSDDGRYVYVGASDRFIDTNECGGSYQSWLNDSSHFPACASRYVRTDIIATLGYNFDASQYAFKDDGYTLEFVAHPVSSHTSFDKVTIKATGYVDNSLGYLALGDSYSSGEGDIEKTNGANHYTPVTDYDGGCHLSDRSYPFLLRDFYKIPAEKMQSVACSGAQVVFDYNKPLAGYLGQGGRLADLSVEDRESQQKTALEMFIPGKVPQLEFVRRYQPKVITLTGGGNDVGFGDILKYCATPSIESFAFGETCGYAVKDSEMEDLLQSAVDSQYYYNRAMINRIKILSPTTRVITVGYPSFIAMNNQACGISAGALNDSEIEMINRFVHKANQMLKQVASDTDSSFVDVEESLVGGRMCEGSEYITNVVDNLTGNAIEQEQFHPNHRGHEKIAETIENSGAMQSSIATAGSGYIPQKGRLTQLIELVSGGEVLQSIGRMLLQVPAGSLRAGADVTVTMYSDTVELGTYPVSSDGSFVHEFDASTLPVGRHVLVLKSVSPSGDRVQFYQFISIGQDEIDFDGDGMPDDEDQCTFIDEWVDEGSGRDICAPSPVRIPDNQSNDTLQEEDSDAGFRKMATGALQPAAGASLIASVHLEAASWPGTSIDIEDVEEVLGTQDVAPTNSNNAKQTTTRPLDEDNASLSILTAVFCGIIGLAIYIIIRIRKGGHG